MQALDGDELAKVRAAVRVLGSQLDQANTTTKQVRRELERERRRWGWIESRNTELAVERDAASPNATVSLSSSSSPVNGSRVVNASPSALLFKHPPAAPQRADAACETATARTRPATPTEDLHSCDGDQR